MTRSALPPSARTVAARVLERVDRDGAFASAALDAELSRHPQLDARERALATELVYGCLRMQKALLMRLEQWAPRGLPKDARVSAHLVVAAYQILVLDRVPAFAAVSAAVEAISAERGTRVAGFANAVLRKLTGETGAFDVEQAIVDSAPAWLRQKLEAVVGVAETRLLLGAAPEPPRVVRLVSGKSPPAWLADAPRGRSSSRARLVTGGGDLRNREGYAEGCFVIQEEGAQLVALALGVAPGERALDACAGRGQKTTLLAEQLGGRGELWAADAHPKKLEVLREEFRRLALLEPATSAVDWFVGPGAVPEGFDRVLVDAPCTGVGTLRRRPEIVRRLSPEDPARLGALQVQILRAATERARPGAYVIYAVCSVLPEEAEEVVAAVSDVLKPTPFVAPELVAIAGHEASSLRLLPGAHGTDGFFMASFIRR